MLKRYYQVFGNIFVLADTTTVVVAWILSYYLRFYTELIPVTKGIPPFSRYMALTVPVALLWFAIFTAFRLYGSNKIIRRTAELGLILRAHGTALFVFLALTYIVSEYRFSRVVIVYFAFLAGVGFIGVRLLIRNSIRKLVKSGKLTRKILVVGGGNSARAIVYQMARMPELGIQVMGFLTEDGASSKDLHAPVLGKFSDLKKITEQIEGLEDVVIALPRQATHLQDEILSYLNLTTYAVHLVPDLYEYIVVGCTVENFENIPMLALNEAPLDPVGKFWKRVIDVCGATVALVLTFPILVIISLLVKLTSRGPVLYGQNRMSVDGTTFKMWKFRSMKTDAENSTGAVWAVQGDDRRTLIGAFLRSTSIDELPQFWNVLKGDMSLVGPRPERPEFVHQFRHRIPKYMLRHKVKSGITGWAQVNGWRGNTSLEQRIECDLYYIKNWTLFLDIKILLLTPLRGLVNKNAY